MNNTAAHSTTNQQPLPPNRQWSSTNSPQIQRRQPSPQRVALAEARRSIKELARQIAPETQKLQFQPELRLLPKDR